MQHASFRWRAGLALLGLLAATMVSTGCGGSHGLEPVAADSAPSQPIPGVGSLRVTVNWGSQSRLIPSASNSIRLIVTNSAEATVGGDVVKRGEDEKEKTTIPNLPVGPVTITAEGYPTTDGKGVAQSRGSVNVTIVKGQTVDAPTLTMDTTVKSLEVTDDTGGKAPVPGQLVTFTATAYDDASPRNVVMLPEPTSSTWSVTNGQELVDTSGATTRQVTSVDKYTLTVVTLATGEVSVEVQTEGAGLSTPAVRDLAIDDTYIPPLGGGGTQITDGWIDTFEGHIGFGYDDQKGAVHGATPFVSGFKPKRTSTGNPIVDSEIGWDFDHRYSERGTHFDMSLQAKYKGATGGVTAAYDRAQSDDSQSITFTVTHYEDWQNYELDPQELSLTKQAAILLRKPQNFLAQYGHRLIIGEVRRNFVTAKYTVAKMTKALSESLGLTWNASYDAAVWSAATKGSYTSKLKEIAEHTSVDVSITTNSTGATGTISEVIAKPDDVDRVLGVIQGLMQNFPGESGAVAYKYITTPMTDVLPALNQGGAKLPFLKENQLAQEFTLWDQYNRAYTRLYQITHDVNEDYTWLPASNVAKLEAAQDDVEQTILTFEDRLKKLIDDPDSVPSLPPSLRQPPTITGWPNPWVRVDLCQIWRTSPSNPVWDFRTTVNIDITVGGVGDISPVAGFGYYTTHDIPTPGQFDGVKQPDGTWRWHTGGAWLGGLERLTWGETVTFDVRDNRGKRIIRELLPCRRFDQGPG